MVGPDGEPSSEGFLLDTNVIIAALEEEAALLTRLRGMPSEALFVPAIVLGELYFGARKSFKAAENLRRLEAFAERSNVLPCDAETARFYGDIKDRLRRKGRPIPENDLWVAATARQHDLTLVTRDSHFEHVEGLRIECW